MTAANDNKTAKLGMALGTAAGRLRKALLFDFVCRLGLDTCFRCGGRIESVETLSIEHKEAWLFADDPLAAFLDLTNIAYSHLSCNAGAGRRNKIYASEKERATATRRRRRADPVRYAKELKDKCARYARKG